MGSVVLACSQGGLHAWLVSLTEVGARLPLVLNLLTLLLVLGLLTPFAGADVVGVKLVAWMINHRGNAFFIFRSGEGWST